MKSHAHAHVHAHAQAQILRMAITPAALASSMTNVHMDMHMHMARRSLQDGRHAGRAGVVNDKCAADPVRGRPHAARRAPRHPHPRVQHIARPHQVADLVALGSLH